MKKNLFILFLIIISSLSANAQDSVAQNWFSLKAFLPAWNNANVELIVDGRLVDRNFITNDIYSFNNDATDVKLAVLILRKDKKQAFLPFFVEQGLVKVRAEKTKLIAFNTSTNDEYNKVNHEIDSVSFSHRRNSNAAIKNVKRKLAADYILTHPTSPASLKLIDDLFYLDHQADDILYFQLFNSLDASLQNSFTGRKIGVDVLERYAVANGRKAAEVYLPDTSGNLNSVYEKGTYTLINFWASWCMACRKELPALKKVFNQYNEKGFAVTAISLDEQKSAWINALKKEKFDWRNLNDNRGWRSEAARAYSIKLLPSNFLLDKEGIIIAKDLSPEELSKKLKELYK